MSSDWTEETLGDLISRDEAHLQTGPFGTALKASEYSEDGVPLISVREIREGFLQIVKDTPRVCEVTTQRLPKFLLQQGDIVFGRKGAVDRNAVISFEQKGWFLGSDGIRLRLSNKYDSLFFSYLMRSSATRAWLLQNSEGTTMLSLNQKTLARVPVKYPPIEIQKRVSIQLQTLDDKITLNTQTNQTLEAMAQAIFKSWFVDFDPVKAKMNGEQPVGMDDATAALFPDKLVESELGLIPEGWEISEIGDEVTVVGGGTPSKKNEEFWLNGNISWTSPKDLSGAKDKVLLDTASKITEEGLKKISSGLLPIDTVLLSSRAPVGYLALTKVPLAINQGYIAMRCEKVLPPEFVIQWCVHTMDEIEQRASGSTFAEISKKNFKPIPVVLPSAKVLSAYQNVVKSLYDTITSNARQNDQLSTLRDTLLPKLLSGEIELGQAQELAEVSV
ncbi:MAG: restriction endonuclease subunit S [Vibrio sp.]